VQKQVETSSANETEQLAQKIGQRLRGGEVIELVSDLGGGKTAFVRGLAWGMGSSDKVASPTFTISKLYKSKDLDLHHFDFYRLPEAGLMAHELRDVSDDPKAVIAVEWGGVVEKVLPKERLTIEISHTGDDNRAFNFKYPDSLKYLTENL